MNRDDNKGITAVCGHPMCDWHTGSMNRDATRTVAKQHAQAHGHIVRMFGSEAQARSDVYRESGQRRNFRTASGRVVLETILPPSPLRHVTAEEAAAYYGWPCNPLAQHEPDSDYCECEDCHAGRGIALKDDNDRRSRQIGAARYEAARSAVDIENDLHLRGLCRATCRYCVAIRQGDAALEEKRCTNQPAITT